MKLVLQVLAILNSDRIHKARKAIGAGVATTAGLLIKQVTAGQSITGSDLAYAIGAGVAALLLVYILPNRIIVPGV